MPDVFANVSSLNCIYLAMVIAGLIYAIGLLLLGEFGGDADGGDADGGVDGDIQIFSPITGATFVTVFGATGLICTIGFGMDPRLSQIVAAFVGAVVSLLVAFVYSQVLIEMQGTTEIRQADMIGIQAEVSTPIPAQGTGEVRFILNNERLSRPARSRDRTAIPRGATVIIERTAADSVIVSPQESDS